MNEKDLKRLFLSALMSGHIRNNTVIPGPEGAELRVVEEANFRSFDLLIAAVSNETDRGRIDAHQEKVLSRTRLFAHFTKRERCRADRISFYPGEIKSDEDSLDSRLPNQIVDAILTFGLSIVVLDKNHSQKALAGRLDKVLPASVICYTGHDDYFEMVSVFDRFVSSGTFNFQRIHLARILMQASGTSSECVHRRLLSLENILQKIIFSQLHFDGPGLTDEEREFVRGLAGVALPSKRKTLSAIFRECDNAKMTDYA